MYSFMLHLEHVQRGSLESARLDDLTLPELGSPYREALPTSPYREALPTSIHQTCTTTQRPLTGASWLLGAAADARQRADSMHLME